MAIDFRPQERWLPGKNGKRYKIPCFAPHGRPDFERFLSIMEYGRPKLNEDEQAIFDAIYPLLADESERLEDATMEQLEGVIPSDADGDFALTFAQKQAPTMDAEDLAYRIAEDLVETGFRLMKIASV